MSCPECRIPAWCERYKRCAPDEERGLANVGLGRALADGMAIVVAALIATAFAAGVIVACLLWWIFG